MNKTFKLLSTAAIAILAFFIILFTGMGIFETIDALRYYTIREDSMIYALEDNRYGDLVSQYHQNMALDVKSSETMKECYAIARYYEAALDYKLALLQNDPALAQKAEQRMETAANDMGALSYAEADINSLLEITP